MACSPCDCLALQKTLCGTQTCGCCLSIGWLWHVQNGLVATRMRLSDCGGRARTPLSRTAA